MVSEYQQNVPCRVELLWDNINSCKGDVLCVGSGVQTVSAMCEGSRDDIIGKRV